MKTGFWDRVLVYLYVLITVLIVIATMLLAFGVDIMQMLVSGLSNNMPGLFWRLIVIGISAMIAVLGIYVSVVITPSRKKKNNFVTISSDNGSEVRVSLPAIREMAGQAIRNAKGLEDVVISVAEASDAIEVTVSMDVESGVHVPTVTMNMQRAIKSNIERNCGINVRSVTVDVKNVLPSADPAAYEEVEVVPVVSEIVSEEINEESFEASAENTEIDDGDVSFAEEPAEEMICVDTEEVAEKESDEEPASSAQEETE